MKIDINNEKAEFACKVCKERMRQRVVRPFIDCAWRGIDGEYCDELVKCLEVGCDETKSN
jgi:hypothetical protein